MFEPARDASNITAPTLFVAAGAETYAYRRLGPGGGLPLLCLQHFTGTLDNWDPGLSDALAAARDVILFDNAGVGRSSGAVPPSIEAMAGHVLAFLDALNITACDVLGFSLGGMIAQQMALERPSLIRRLILVGTAPRGGEDIMHVERPPLSPLFQDPLLAGLTRLQKLFFAPSATSQAAGAAFIARISQRTQDRDPVSGPEVAQAQVAAFRAWERVTGERFADLKRIGQPTLVVNGVHDQMIPVRNSYWLAENLPNAVLTVYPDAGHGSLFQYHDAFARQALAFLASDAVSAVD